MEMLRLQHLVQSSFNITISKKRDHLKGFPAFLCLQKRHCLLVLNIDYKIEWYKYKIIIMLSLIDKNS